MPLSKIDNQDFDLDTLSAGAKAQRASLQFVDAALQWLSAQTTLLPISRAANGSVLHPDLAAPHPWPAARASCTLMR